ncbi:MAG TPA: phosphatidylserine decarboxylase [Gammaproteobacteria bacterium]|nr:phosphatidylserine decarboxylase [Gammaproteobacteria bacterium]
MFERLKVGFQYLLPQKQLSLLMGDLARIESHWFKDPFIYWFINRYGVNMEEAVHQKAEDYRNFHEFFTRPLIPGCRPIEGDDYTVVSPVDGSLSQLGNIYKGNLVQAKNRAYSLAALLGKDDNRVQQFQNGCFATIYLAPQDYHRVHMPSDGQLLESLYIPGKLFSVNPLTAKYVDNLFAINERLVIYLDTSTGPIAVIMVGALIVGGIETTWTGAITPPHGHTERWVYQQEEMIFRRGDELGRFAMGSTVIVLFSQQNLVFSETLQLNQSLKMGQAIGRFK